MHRLAVSAKRKVLLNPKTVAIYVFAIFFTFLLAYHQRLGNAQNEHTINSFRIIQMKYSGNSQQNSEKKSIIDECEEPPNEVKSDFNTFDLFQKTVGNGQSIGENRKNRKNEKLKVFVLPFTHVDPGWLETYESYTKRTNQILDNMHNFMMKNEKMRFMWAEFVFFERWWSQQSEEVRKDVRSLVSSGRLELATGSWVMTDEANPYFPVSVDNIVEGFQFIEQNFGVKPSTMWSNDPFGYSNTVPFLFKKSGVSRAVINRIHHTLKQSLQAHRAIPFRWRQFFSSAEDVLTHVLPYTHYDVINSCGPDFATCCEFDFKRITHWSCPGPKPTNVTVQNVNEKANKLVTQLEKQYEMYKAPVILMMHGDDFRYDMIEEWHQQHDNFLPVFEEINKGTRAEIRFGTFSDYFNELEAWFEHRKDELDVQAATVTGDFFPYMCALGDYWTGYFTTRPFFKRQGRLLHSLIRSADVMLSMLRPTLKQRKIDENIRKLENSRRNLSLFQHHDAITGTSKVSVMKDYSQLLHNSILSTKEVLEELGKGSLNSYPRTQDGVEVPEVIDFRKNARPKEIKLFNSLLFELSDVFSVRTNEPNLVFSIDGLSIDAQVEPFFLKGKPDKDSFLILFRAKIPALSMIRVRISKENSNEKNEKTKMARIETKSGQENNWDLGSAWKIEKIDFPSEFSLETTILKTLHNSTTGSLQTIHKIAANSTFQCQQTWQKYRDAGGGAYLMKLHTNPMEIHAFRWLRIGGDVRQSVLQFADTIWQRTSVKNVQGAQGEQVDIWMSVDISGERNTELMTRFTTDWPTPSFFTDSLGLQLIRRDFYRLPVQNNYYPMPTAAVIENAKQRLSIVSNVEHGARFMEHGGVEINIDRILNQDDGKGLGSGADSIPTDMKAFETRMKLVVDELQQPLLAEPSHYSVHTLGAQQAVQSVVYPAVQLDEPKIDVSSGGGDVEEIDADSDVRFPRDIQLLTVRPLSDNRQLLILFRHATRLSSEHREEKNIDNASPPLHVALRNLLIRLGARRVQRTDLSGITPIGSPQKVEHLDDIHLETFDFATFVLYR